MENNPPITCPKCGKGIRHIPAGISKKTGKPYNEFWACSGCDFTWKVQASKQDNVLNALMIINDNIKSLHAKVDKITDFFTTKGA